MLYTIINWLWFVPRISSRQQSSLIGDESAPSTISALHAATMERASLSSKSYLLMCIYIKWGNWLERLVYTELQYCEIQWELTLPHRMLIQDTFHANGWDFRSSPVKNRGERREGARKGGREGDYLTNIWEQLDVCSSVTVFTWFAVSRPLETCLWPLAICTKEVLVKCVTSSHGFLNPPIS